MEKEKMNTLGQQPQVSLEEVANTLATTGQLPAGMVPMNRQQRRKMKRAEERAVKKTVKKHDQKMNQMQTPATISEVVQIATSVAMDVVNNYHKQSNPVIVSMSLHLEIIKNRLIEKGLITEEEFDKLFEESVQEFNRLREEKLKEVDGESVDGKKPSGEAALDEHQGEAVATSPDVPSATDVDNSTAE